MRAGQMIADLFDRLFSRGAADLGLRSGAEAFRHLQTHLDDAFRARGGQRLGVGIGDDEVDPDQSRDDHVVDGVAAGSADPANHDAGLQFPELGRFEIDGHRLASRRWSTGQGRPGLIVRFIR